MRMIRTSHAHDNSTAVLLGSTWSASGSGFRGFQTFNFSPVEKPSVASRFPLGLFPCAKKATFVAYLKSESYEIHTETSCVPLGICVCNVARFGRQWSFSTSRFATYG
jgi:hypothetical protein